MWSVVFTKSLRGPYRQIMLVDFSHLVTVPLLTEQLMLVLFATSGRFVVLGAHAKAAQV